MGVEVRALTDAEAKHAGAVAARALRDNPMMAYMMPNDALARLQTGYDTFGDRIAAGMIGALVGGHVIGVAGANAPGGCLGATAPPELRSTPKVSPAEAVGVDRARHMVSVMCDHDPEERHIHVGPVGVEPGVQGLGVGGALLGPHVIGVAAAVLPGTCIGATAAGELRERPDVDPVDAVGFDRTRHVISVMCDHDPEERHVHVGPVGVEPGSQGLGVGGAMLAAVAERLDHDGEVGWLETDKPENVVFYRRHGFDVDVEERRLGIPIWFMRRTPR